MPHLRTLSLRDGDEEGWPFDVPAVARLGERAIEAPVLFFVGENGSGKSTLMEALAIGSRRVTVGAADAARDPTLEALHPLAKRLRSMCCTRPRRTRSAPYSSSLEWTMSTRHVIGCVRD